MPLSLRPIAAVAVIGALSLLTAGCTAGDDTSPKPSASRSATADGASTPTAKPTGPGSGNEPAESSDLPTSIADGGQSGQPSDPDTASAFPATAVVTYASWDAGSSTLQTAGLVTGTSDTSGTCTFTAKRGGTTRTATSRPNAGASSVTCTEATFPKAQLGTGSWSVTLTYSVGDASTTSNPTTAEVP